VPASGTSEVSMPLQLYLATRKGVWIVGALSGG
jgi:hypothetical protein